MTRSARRTNAAKQTIISQAIHIAHNFNKVSPHFTLGPLYNFLVKRKKIFLILILWYLYKEILIIKAVSAQ